MKDNFQYSDQNRLRWNELVGHHMTDSSYDLDALVSGKSTINHLERTLMGDLSGMKVLHLQCHFGLDSLSLFFEGATEVVGVDFSELAIEQARKLADELALNARFIHSDIMDLASNFKEYGSFDWVFTTYGTIGWLPDLDKWASAIAAYLKPGGSFIIVDSHPFSHVFDDEVDHGLIPKFTYFSSKEPLHFEVEGSYATAAELEHNDEYLWMHSLQEIFSVLLNNGLQINTFGEYDKINWLAFPFLVPIEDEKGWYTFPPDFKPKIPLLFSIVAHKPEI